jgi:hypothetical protein
VTGAMNAAFVRPRPPPDFDRFVPRALLLAPRPPLVLFALFVLFVLLAAFALFAPLRPPALLAALFALFALFFAIRPPLVA